MCLVNIRYVWRWSVTTDINIDLWVFNIHVRRWINTAVFHLHWNRAEEKLGEGLEMRLQQT